MNVFSSIKKTFELNKLAKRIANPKTVTVDDLLSDSPSDSDLLFDLVYRNDDLRAVVERYSADREVLNTIYLKLMAHGGCQWVRGDYVLVSAFGFFYTLDYVLRSYSKADVDWWEVTDKLVKNFKNGWSRKIVDGG